MGWLGVVRRRATLDDSHRGRRVFDGMEDLSNSYTSVNN